MFVLGKRYLTGQVSTDYVQAAAPPGGSTEKKRVPGAHIQHSSCRGQASQLLAKLRATEHQGWEYLEMVPSRVQAGTGLGGVNQEASSLPVGKAVSFRQKGLTQGFLRKHMST